jgi:flagellar basal-body rod protein FlgG
MLSTNSTSAVAVQGQGFFAIQGADGQIFYTRNGDFTWAISPANNTLALTTSDGQAVLNTNGQPIAVNIAVVNAGIAAENVRIDAVNAERTRIANANNREPVLLSRIDPITANNPVISTQITISADGSIFYSVGDADISLEHTISLWQFSNVGGLERMGNSLYRVTDASGAAQNEVTTPGLRRSSTVQGYLEGSNVYVADEMVNLIVAQRAYEMNSKAITTSDEMMQTANNLKR